MEKINNQLILVKKKKDKILILNIIIIPKPELLIKVTLLQVCIQL